MVSRTKVTKCRRANKKKKMGVKRKTADRIHGTTPKFKVHEDK